MKNTARKAAVSLFAGATLAVGALAPASAAPVVTGGLVNVTVTDVANNILRDANVGVGAALGIAANVCGVGVNVLARQLPGPVSCTSTSSGQTATIDQI